MRLRVAPAMTQYVLTPTILPLLLAQVATLLMAGNVLHRLGQPVQRAFFLLLVANSVWLTADTLAELARPASLRWLWVRVAFLGVLTMPVAWVVLVERYLRPYPEPYPPRRAWPLLVVPAVTLLLIWTNDQHQLIWTYVGAVRDWDTLTRTPLYWLGVVVYANALLAWGVVRLLHSRRAARGVERTQIGLMLLAVILPTVTNLLYLLGAEVLPDINPTPVGFAVGLIPVAWGMARHGLLRVTPLAHRQIVDQLADAVLVLDTRGRIVDANRQAAHLAGAGALALRGRHPPEVLPGWPSAAEGQPAEWVSGEAVWEVQLSTVRNAGGSQVGQAVVARDVTTRAREHARVQRLAHQDALTGLGNRRAFEEDLRREEARATRQALCLGVVMIDLDGLKGVNDRRGHQYGDTLLQVFGQALGTAFRTQDRAYRIGGDEFAVLLTPTAVAGEPAVQERIARAVEAVQAQGFPEIGASVGVGYFPHDGAGEALVQYADARMYEEKARHRAQRSPPRGSPKT